MAVALKDANTKPLVFAMLANAALFYAAVQTDAILGADWVTVARGWMAAVPACATIPLLGICNALLSSNAKARLIFWRWSDPLPASQAFSKHARRDPRVDQEVLKKKYGPFPRGRKDQNALWYKLYKTVENRPEVLQVHRQFLFSRDYACGALLLLIVLAPFAVLLIPSWNTTAAYLGLLIIQFATACRAARVHGARFVTTVLALKGAGK